MATCDCCGNNYDKSFQLILRDTTYHFDSFECAIHLLAPTCSHCGCRVIGHGVESGTEIFCCAHCAEAAGHNGLKDRA